MREFRTGARVSVLQFWFFGRPHIFHCHILFSANTTFLEFPITADQVQMFAKSKPQFLKATGNWVFRKVCQFIVFFPKVWLPFEGVI